MLGDALHFHSLLCYYTLTSTGVDDCDPIFCLKNALMSLFRKGGLWVWRHSALDVHFTGHVKSFSLHCLFQTFYYLVIFTTIYINLIRSSQLSRQILSMSSFYLFTYHHV